LAAILAADVAGYSRLMEVDEEGTHDRLKAHFSQLVHPKIKEHRGRIVKNTGDGLLAEFSSVLDAVCCASEIQRGMIDREAEVVEDRRIGFRIGINLGDVIVEEDDVCGDGVNIAARFEALAESGGICVSRVVRDQVRDRLDVTFRRSGRAAAQKHRTASTGVPGPGGRPCSGNRSSPAAAAKQTFNRGTAVRQYK
jgi:adenylate cyclase